MGIRYINCCIVFSWLRLSTERTNTEGTVLYRLSTKLWDIAKSRTYFLDILKLLSKTKIKKLSLNIYRLLLYALLYRFDMAKAVLGKFYFSSYTYLAVYEQ